MKFESLIIALFTLGLVVSVPTVKMALAEPLQRRIAQTEPASLAEKIQQWNAEEVEQFKVCDRVSQAEANVRYEGDYGFDDFQGVNLADEQQSAFNTISAQLGTEREEIYKNTVSIVNPIAPLSFSWSEWDLNLVPQEIQTAVQAALDKNPTFDQKAALDQEFGEYGKFYGSYITYITPEQRAQLAQNTEDFYTQVQDIMTPEQLPQYQKNLATRLKINEACDQRNPISD